MPTAWAGRIRHLRTTFREIVAARQRFQVTQIVLNKEQVNETSDSKPVVPPVASRFGLGGCGRSRLSSGARPLLDRSGACCEIRKGRHCPGSRQAALLDAYRSSR